MKIPFWSPTREYRKYQREIDAAIHRVLSKGQLCLGFGPDIEEFEKAFAEFLGAKYAVMCGAGTHALYLVYKASGVGPGDEVITTSHTFIATIDQIVAVGAKPILVDIGDDGLIDPEKIEAAITVWTKAIVPVHLEGKLCDLARIDEIADRHELLIIEDAAQAIGAGWQSENTRCYSFYPAKVLGAIGNAGMVTTNDPELAEKIRLMRCNYDIGKNPDIEGAEYGGNYEPDNIQAAVLLVKMKYLDERLARRKEIAERYLEAFKDLPVKLPLNQENRVWQDFVLRVGDSKKLADFLKEQGIGTLGVSLIPNHKYPKLGLNFYLPKTEEYLKHQIRIPCNPDLKNIEVEYIIKKVRECYAE